MEMWSDLADAQTRRPRRAEIAPRVGRSVVDADPRHEAELVAEPAAEGFVGARAIQLRDW